MQFLSTLVVFNVLWVSVHTLYLFEIVPLLRLTTVRVLIYKQNLLASMFSTVHGFLVSRLTSTGASHVVLMAAPSPIHWLHASL